MNDEWMLEAACRNHENPAFYERTKNTTREFIIHLREAKALCSKCPVIDECLAKANSFPYGVSGVWGGLTEEERKRYLTVQKTLVS